jgi:hypothetical protein
MMNRLLFMWGIVLLSAQTSWALSTDFEDLVLDTEYSVGETINSGNLSFDVVDFPDTVSGADVAVRNGNDAGGSGLELNLIRSIGLDFQLPGEVQGVSFLFADFFSIGTGLVINGSESTLGSGLPPLDGTTLGGVDISVTGMAITGGVRGMVVLDGPIQSLIVGGTEFYIDDVTVIVPEPASLALAVVGASVLLALREKKRLQRRRYRPASTPCV